MALSGQAIRARVCPLLDHSGQSQILARVGLSVYDAVDGAHSEASECYRVVALKRTRMKEVRLGNDDGV